LRTLRKAIQNWRRQNSKELSYFPLTIYLYNVTLYYYFL